MFMPDTRIFAPHSEIIFENNVTDADGKLNGANAALCRAVGEHLERVYPGHPWLVSAEIEHGVVRIMLMGFAQWPVVIHVATLKSDPRMLSVTKYVGELLERLRMPRNGFSLQDWRSGVSAMPHYFFRNEKPPV